MERKKRRGKEARFGYSFYLFTQGSRPPLAQTQYRSRFIFYSSLIEFELNLAKVSPLPFFLSLSLSPSLFASSLPLWIVIFFSLFLPFPRLLPVDRYSNLPVCSLLSTPSSYRSTLRLFPLFSPRFRPLSDFAAKSSRYSETFVYFLFGSAIDILAFSQSRPFLKER